MTDNSSHMDINFVDIEGRRIYAATIYWQDGYITKIEEFGPENPGLDYLIPGFVDAHVHVESTMLTPSEFGRMASRQGTIATISDPHEIANVLGIEGVRYMAENAATHSPIPIYFGAPACVPATDFENAGATLSVEDIERLFAEGRVDHLAEVMDFPGVLARDPSLMDKIEVAKSRGCRVDGHAPGLKGSDAQNYAAAGIHNDHECSSIEEAEDKLAAGMDIIIREGSAAKNLDALWPLIDRYPDRIMFCTDDLHPDDLVLGHVNRIAAGAIRKGADLFNVLRAACVNPVKHYDLDAGQLRVGDFMDGVVVKDLNDFEVILTLVGGLGIVLEGENVRHDHHPPEIVNNFNADRITADDLVDALPQGNSSSQMLRVIECREGALDTRELILEPTWDGDNRPAPDPDRDILMMAVVNRYNPALPAVAFIRGFGIKDGAIAGSIAHDSHNIIAVGSSAHWVADAVNEVVGMEGGIIAAGATGRDRLPLPIAGLMSNADGNMVALRYKDVGRVARAMGVALESPFMTLSFMALLVIPALKLSDQGLFDGQKFEFVPLLTH